MRSANSVIAVAFVAVALLLSACNQAGRDPDPFSFEGKIPIDGALIYRK